MRVYLVFREGAYRHELVAVTRSALTAHNYARAACAAQADDYHIFSVNEADTPRGGRVVLPSKGEYGTIEDAAVYRGCYLREDKAAAPGEPRWCPAEEDE